MNPINNPPFNTGQFNAGKLFNQQYRRAPAGQGSGSVSQNFGGHNSPPFININQFHHPGNYNVTLSLNGIQGAARGGQHAYRQPDVHGVNAGALVAAGNNPWPSFPGGYIPAPVNQPCGSPFQGVGNFDGQGYRLGTIKEVVPTTQSPSIGKQ